MRNTTRCSLALGTALTLSLAVAGSVTAQAQTAPGAPQPAGAGQTPPSAAASAPRPAPANEPSAENVVVTARRTSERAQTVPISIKVFNQAQLTNRNVVTATDLALYTPSLSSNSDFGSENTTFAIRGFVQDIGTQPSVGVYFADVVAPRGGSNNIPAGDGASAGEFFDLQNVQVLKGPQGTLFGLNTTGGAILLVPQKPTSEYGGYIEGSYGNYDMQRIQAVANFPFSDNVRFRIGIDHETRDGYLNNDTGIGPTHFGDIDYVAVRPSLVWDITPDIENYSILNFTRSDQTGDIQKLVGCNPSGLGLLACAQLQQEQAKGAGFYTVQNTLPNPYSKLTQFQGINTTTWQATDTLTVKNIISYAQLTDNLQSALFGTNFDLHALLPGVFKPGTVVDFAQSLPVEGGNTADESTFTEELQFQGRLPDWHLTYQSGIYLELSDPIGLAGSESPILLDCKNVYTYDCTNPTTEGSINYTAGRMRSKDIGVYSQVTYAFTDQLKLTGGARYTWDNTSDTSYLFTNALVSPGVIKPACSSVTSTLPDCAVYLTQSSRAPTWLIDLDYTPIRDVLLYAKYSRGYRDGGITAQLPAPFDTFQAERVNTYEAGVKTSFAGALHGIFNVDGFYNDFGNQQLELGFQAKPGTSVSPASGIINAGKSRIYGAEIESSITPVRGLTFTADYTYLRANALQVSAEQTPASSPYEIEGAITAGDKLALSPTNKASLSGTYVFPINPNWGRVSFGTIFTYIDPQVANYADRAAVGVPSIENLGTLQSRRLLNFNLNWNSVMGRPVDLSFFATNVTDDKYYAWTPGVYGPQTGFETAVLGEPAMFGFRLKYRFGI